MGYIFVVAKRIGLVLAGLQQRRVRNTLHGCVSSMGCSGSTLTDFITTSDTQFNILPQKNSFYFYVTSGKARARYLVF